MKRGFWRGIPKLSRTDDDAHKAPLVFISRFTVQAKEVTGLVINQLNTSRVSQSL
jgi:hypothetical protein